ncbi:MAG: ketoacyl-ACP synthase III, partial [Planctomycetes bacterium]|nr:ketoacyl-ACP synthase III [Planctomycetota bacterium]
MSSTISPHNLPAPSDRRSERERRAESFPADRRSPSGRSRLGTLTGVRIAATGSYLPETVVTNGDLAKLGYDEQWIVQRTGIYERRHAPPEMATSDVAYEAAVRCLSAADVSPRDVDLIVLATMTPDSPMPTTACLLQERLGCIAPALEMNAACAGFMYAMVTGMQYVKTGCSRRALVVGADLMSRAVNPADSRTYPLFGDGGGAVLLTAGDEDQGLLSFTLGSEGDAEGVLRQPAGGTREPLTGEKLEAGRHFIHMEGRAVFKWAVRVLIDATRDVLCHAGLGQDDLDVAVLHQANIRIIESAIADLEIDRSKVLINLNRYGNTSAGSMPLVLDEAC